MGRIKKTILILGGSGFIGKNLVERLHNQYHLLTPTHSQLNLLNGEKVTTYFRSHKIDVVINGAVVGGSRKEEHEENALRNNLLMFFNLIDNRKYYRKLIHFGSGAEYDKSRSLVKIRENQFGQRIPKDEYGFFKYLCSRYFKQTKFNIINLRTFGLFGPYEDYRFRFISQAICRNIFGLPIIINQNVFFDYVYIDDFERIVEYFIQNSARHKFYNIGTGQRINLITIAKKINKIATKKSKIIVKIPGLNKEYTCNNSRLIHEIKNLKFTKFDDAVKKLYNWYHKNKHLINKKELL